VLTQVPFGQRAEDGINNSMGQHIRIRMSQQAQWMGNFDASEDQRTSLHKAVGIISKTDTEHIDLYKC
jgi:hypothetical protein